jgi:hypothetical protein
MIECSCTAVLLCEMLNVSDLNYPAFPASTFSSLSGRCDYRDPTTHPMSFAGGGVLRDIEQWIGRRQPLVELRSNRIESNLTNLNSIRSNPRVIRFDSIRFDSRARDNKRDSLA